jgi:hypothetical protein
LGDKLQAGYNENMRKKFFIICVLVSMALLLWVVAVRNTQEVPLQGEKEEVSTPAVFILRMGETQSGFGISLTPTGLLEDSRCPPNVNCIQAGTVRLEASLQSGPGGVMSQVFVLGDPVQRGGNTIVLTEVRPEALSGESIATEDYQFVFTVPSSVIPLSN